MFDFPQVSTGCEIEKRTAGNRPLSVWPRRLEGNLGADLTTARGNRDAVALGAVVYFSEEVPAKCLARDA
jgi:hypothetical protein